jgi:hypothetical protein
MNLCISFLVDLPACETGFGDIRWATKVPMGAKGFQDRWPGMPYHVALAGTRPGNHGIHDHLLPQLAGRKDDHSRRLPQDPAGDAGSLHQSVFLGRLRPCRVTAYGLRRPRGAFVLVE